MKQNMNKNFLKAILNLEQGVMATILETEGHTYKQAGARALYTDTDLFPVRGNLGAGCYDSEIRRVREQVLEEEKPIQIEFETVGELDVHFGSGTGCGGRIRVLVEPVKEIQKKQYRVLLEKLEKGEPVFVSHHLETGAIELHEEQPEEKATHYVEWLEPPRRVFLFGATPLSRTLIQQLQDLPLEFVVVDWRKAFRDSFRTERDVEVIDEMPDSLPDDAFIILLSHHYEREKKLLEQLSNSPPAYVAMLSSTGRRDRMFNELRKNDVKRSFLEQVHSPAGLDIDPETDSEIAISIAAEVVENL